MSREIEIADMENVIAEIFSDLYFEDRGPDSEVTAERLYDAGYRKASEVAEEIFAEIENEIKNHGICYAHRKIAELKKKYTEGGE